MTTWFSSRKGAITLSLIALISLLARSYYDIRYILVEEFSSLAPGMDVLWIVSFTVIVGGNMAVLLAATGNSRGAWIGLLVYNLVIGLGSGAASLVAFTSNNFELVIFTASLIAGVLAAIAVGLQLRRERLNSQMPIPK
jgi:hypothetical protein